MVARALLILALATGAAAQHNPCQPHPVCNQDELKRCQLSFDVDLGIDQTLDVNSYDRLADAVIAQIANNGSVGLENICRSLRTFKTCFTDVRDYDRCMFNPLGLVGDKACVPTGISEAAARGYTRLFTALDFSCGFGYSHFWNAEDQNPGCMSGVFKNKLDDLHRCQSEFDANVAANPAYMCSFVGEASNCFQRQFRNCGSMGMWFGCEFERMGLQAAYGNCGQEFCRLRE